MCQMSTSNVIKHESFILETPTKLKVTPQAPHMFHIYVLQITFTEVSDVLRVSSVFQDLHRRMELTQLSLVTVAMAHSIFSSVLSVTVLFVVYFPRMSRKEHLMSG